MEVNLKDFFLPLEEFEKELGLKWEVIYLENKKEFGLEVLSLPEKKIHEIRIDPRIFKYAEIFLPALLQTLCRCKLTEMIDPIFSVYEIIFPKGLPLKKEEILTYVKYATQYLEIWENDLRNFYWPEVTFLAHANFRIVLKNMKEKGVFDFFSKFSGILDFAIFLTEEKRYCLRELPSLSSLSSFLESLPEDLGLARSFILEVSRFLETLPPLPHEREKALRIIESFTPKYCQILKLPVLVYLEKERNRCYWKVEVIEGIV
ncbi:MAG TPA: hypothetical protein ENG32_01460 [bacterium]|nr:hypothetical protein [bacterium]